MYLTSLLLLVRSPDGHFQGLRHRCLSSLLLLDGRWTTEVEGKAFVGYGEACRVLDSRVVMALI